ncbi:MAG: bifunctional (p)ppGpp synthetase/guanosine-3',5'-bis(diphosphate) 3'-pyrophosphohydrolase [Candidatus Solibacter usitatus]|nr:bifunctional (p)ppGpp synthetase/guanosine-3',5'-bis(diphosphate) 3'-pyrophosphohydrolase [Candidatus Solibacter usitatus]
MDSALIFYAIQFASAAHAGQYRKGTRVPYLIHPICVARILIEAGCPEELAVAAILHDTVEDCFVTYEQITKLFGERVASLVRGASEPDKSASWEARKQHTVQFLQTASEDLLLVSVADKLDNIRSIREDLALHGEDLAWSRFKRGRDHQRWYYQSLAETFSGRLASEPGASLARVFHEEVQAVFA